MFRAWKAVSTGVLLLLPLWAWAIEVHDVRLWRAPDHTRIVFDLDAPAQHKLITLTNPSRIVVDLPQTALKTDVAGLDWKSTPVARMRSGVRNGSDLRIVLDLNTEVDPRSFALKANDKTGDRLVLDLYDKALQQTPVKKSVAQSPQRDIVIAIDAGHGGEDPGAMGPSRVPEKKVVMAIARDLAKLLEKERGFKPTLLRDGDYYIGLKARRDLARKRQADLLVSIHADAFKLKQANGASVYALSTRGATSTTASYLAQRENATDLIGGVSLGDKDDVLAGVLADLSMTSTLDASLQLGGHVLSHVDDVAKLHKRNVEQAAFAVLKSPDIPSILVETGFISNPSESRKLASRKYQQKMAKAIYRGIKEWFGEHPPSGTWLAWQKQQADQQYTIARGDTLSDIAYRFNVPLSKLKSHNKISGSKIMIGQKLTIPKS